MTPRSLSFTVVGTPAPQGSKRHVGNGVMVESSKKVKPWREAVKTAAIEAIDAADWPIRQGGATHVELTFLFPRPKSHYRTGRNSHLLRDDAPVQHTNRPDVEKLTRSTYDAFTEAGIWDDDCRAYRSDNTKAWAGPDERPGALVTVRAYSNQRETTNDQ